MTSSFISTEMDSVGAAYYQVIQLCMPKHEFSYRLCAVSGSHCSFLSSSKKHRGIHMCESDIVGITWKYGRYSAHVSDEERH